ncbi:MAG: hypothetical protein EON55_00185 [Alphaproteobacteria bacterium]|nr:MAG: hypothetical protein EON55_00185 [Alphaproteobacteria bacterium]
MTTPNFFKRGTLLVPSGPPGKKHLHVICTDPDPTGRQILVSISTFKPGHDETCILLSFQHPWLWKDKSFVDYGFAALREHRELIRGVELDVFIPMDDIDRQTFGRIRSGIERSPFTPGPIVRHYRNALVVERGASAMPIPKVRSEVEPN